MASNIIRKYRISDSVLIGEVGRFCNRIADDLPLFEPFGIDQAYIDSIMAVRTKLEDLQSEGYNIGERMEQTMIRKELAGKIVTTIRSMAMRVALKWGEASQEYRQLGSMNLTVFSQSELLRTAKVVHTMMTEYQPNLTEFGLTQAILDEYNAMINQYEANISERIKIEQTRTEDTINRIATGNELYDMLRRTVKVAKLAVPHKAEFYNMPQPRKKKKKESDADGEKGEMKEGKF